MSTDPNSALRVAMLASCTVDLCTPTLLSALAARGLPADVWAAGFGQYRQAILDLQSELYRFAPQFVILYLDGEDLFSDLLENPLDFDAGRRRELVAQAASELKALVEKLSGALPRTTILLNSVTLPPANILGGLEYNSGFSVQEVAAAWNSSLAEIVRNCPAGAVVDIAGAAASMGYENWRDSRLWYLARSRWSRRAMREVARRYTGAIACRMGLMRKCLVVDLDNTLWGGIVGEDGPAALQLGEEGTGLAYQEFQIELRSLQRQGVLLAVCSKNNHDEALQVMASHPAMRLRPEHFAAMRINWQDKASNLRAIAEELNIGLDTLVLIDDNPAERSWVRDALPQVYVPDWPEDPGEFKAALYAVAADYLHKLDITGEDRERGRQYREQAERRTLAAGARSLEDFYRSLAMRATIAPLTPVSLPRIAQLTQKTNQFNLTTRRYTEPQVSQMAADGCLVYSLELDDRFGKNGIVGVMILCPEDGRSWLIDTFLLSCRVVGRTVEQAFLGFVCRRLAAAGALRLVGEYRPTAKNAPVANVYSTLGFLLTAETPEHQLWTLDLTTREIPIPEWFSLSAAGGQTEIEYARQTPNSVHQQDIQD